MVHDPVHRAEKLHAEGRLEAFDEGRDPIEALKRFGPLGQKGPRFVDRAGQQRDGRLGAVLAVAEAARVVALDVTEGLAEVVGVGAVVVRGVLEAEALSGELEEVGELLHFDERQLIVIPGLDVSTHQGEHGGASLCHRGPLASIDDLLCGGCLGGLEQNHPHLGRGREGLDDERTHLRPVEPAVAASEGRHRDRRDAESLHLLDEVAQTVAHVLDLRGLAPMPLRWEVDDEAGRREPLDNVHPPGLNFARSARSLIRCEIVWKCLLELEREALAHHTLGVDGVHHGLDVGR